MALLVGLILTGALIDMPRNNLIAIRQGTTTPSAVDFAIGEPAWDKTGKKLYIKAGDGTMVEIAGGGGGGGSPFTASTTVPSAPVSGQQWLDLNSGRFYFYSSDGNSSQWVELSIPVAGPSFLANANPPSQPNVGDEWLNTDTGIGYRYIATASGSQWVEVT